MKTYLIPKFLSPLLLTTLWSMLATAATAAQPTPPDQILLKDYRPRSIFKIPETRVERARYPAIDMHAHNYTPAPAEMDGWVRMMDEVGVEKSVILASNAGREFDTVLASYQRHPTRFIVWCGFDYRGFNQPGWTQAAIAELERCHRAGATGVGELMDKGRGLGASSPTSPVQTPGAHIDDPRFDALLEKCADLGMPVNIHVAEDQWKYEPMDVTNDGLMDASKWQVPNEPGVMQHDDLIATLGRAVQKHPRTVFIACHVGNCCADLGQIGALLDRYPNLHVDIAARYAELAPIPRAVARFFDRYQDRILYGTDMTPAAEIYRITFRLLETDDEHFYPEKIRKNATHWAMNAWALPDAVLKKVYRDNALRLLTGVGPTASTIKTIPQRK